MPAERRIVFRDFSHRYDVMSYEDFMRECLSSGTLGVFDAPHWDSLEVFDGDYRPRVNPARFRLPPKSTGLITREIEDALIAGDFLPLPAAVRLAREKLADDPARDSIDMVCDTQDGMLRLVRVYPDRSAVLWTFGAAFFPCSP